MTGLRSVVLTLQLMVVLAELFLPLVSHQWMSLRVWHVSSPFEIHVHSDLNAADVDSNTLSPALAAQGTDGSVRLWLVSDAEMWSDLLLLGAQLMLLWWAISAVFYVLRRWFSFLASFLTAIIDLPPPDVPPRLVIA